MKRLRTIVMGITLAALAVLAVLSIVGAFLGAEDARALFNSAPVTVYWIGLALLLAAGFVVYPRLVKRPAGLAMHLGVLLILGGGMWGSDTAHAVRGTLFDAEKVPRGFMAIQEGTRENRVLGPDGQEVVAQLPFDLALRDFRMEYYQMPGLRWHLAVVAPLYGGDGRLVDQRQAEVPWEGNETVPLPLARAEVTVLEYLPHARPTYAEGAAPAVEVVEHSGKTHRLPAREGAEVTLGQPPMTVRVVRVFTCMKVRRTEDGDLEPYEAGGEGINPAVELAFVRPDGTPERRFALAIAPGHGRRQGDPDFRYVFPEPTGAEKAPDSSVPAMHVRVTRGDREMTRWLLPGPGDPYASIDLAPLFPDGAPPRPDADRAEEPVEGQGASAPPEPPEDRATPDLYLVRPNLPVRDYYSDLAVLDDGETVFEKTIEVNDPLRWGGYHFYQSDYDHEAGRYTVLQVVSDSGLWLVWVGMVLLVGGAFWRFWGEAILTQTEIGTKSEIGNRKAETGNREAEDATPI
ncbi:MAG: cytochrome c biogenesis protein ResB [Phycisphaerae bacterium]